MDAKETKALSRNTHITIGAAIAVCAVMLSCTWWLSAKVTTWERDLADIQNQMVGKTPGGWHKTDMKRWAEETKRLNPEWKPAPAWNKHDYREEYE